MHTNITTHFEMFLGQDEIIVTISGQINRGQDAARDNYGRPTECATAPEAFTTFVRILGKEYTDKEAAELFDLTLEEWDDRCCYELIEALERLEKQQEIEDDLPF